MPKQKSNIPKKDKYINQQWLKKLIDSIDRIRDKAYIMYHVETGLRVTEIINTEIQNIDFDNNRTFTYDQKKDEWRYVYWPTHVAGVLKQWLEYRKAKGIKDKRLFPFTEKTANRIIKSWCKKIEFPLATEVGTHWLRHTFIRLSRKAGRDIKAVQQNTGDTVKTILDWYSELDDQEMKNEINQKPLIE